MAQDVMAFPMSSAEAACHDSVWPTLPDLTRAMAKLNDAAWTEFHVRYLDRLLRYALTLHRGDRATAEDSVQAALLRAVRHIRVFSDEEVFWSWLTLLVRCAATDAGRKLASRTRLQEALIQEQETWLGTARRHHSPNEETRFVLLEEALSLLDDEERQLLTDKYAEGHSHLDLAKKRHLTPKAIENRLRRLRHRLKAQLHELAKRTRA